MCARTHAVSRKISHESPNNRIAYDSDLEEKLLQESRLTSAVAKKLLAENVATLTAMRNYFRLKMLEDRAGFEDFKLLQTLCTSINREMERMKILVPEEVTKEDSFL